MNVRKQAAALLLCLSLAASLVACQRPGATEGTRREGSEQTGTEQREQTEMASVPQTDPTNFYEEVQEDLLIDAEVKGTASGAKPKVYLGEMKVFTKEEIDDFLAWNGDAVSEVTQDGLQGNEMVYAGTCRSGSTFGQGSSEEGLYPSIFSYVNQERYERYNAYPIYSTQLMYEENEEHLITYLFTEPKDLSFATAQEAETEVREALATLHLGELYLNRTLYVSHERMAQAGEELQSEKWTHEVKGRTAQYPQRDDWAEEDDCYMFEFFCAADGIPLACRGEKSNTVSYCPNSIVVWYTKDGIIDLEVIYPVTFVQVVEEPEQFISAGEALEVAKNKFVNILATQKRTIERVELVYVYWQDGTRWLLRPMWEVTVRQAATETVSFDTLRFVRVDAMTGDEM